jgi:hypothetical protein
VSDLVNARNDAENKDSSEISIEGFREGVPGETSTFELGSQGCLVREATGIQGDSSDGKVRSDKSSGEHNHELLSLQDEETASSSASNNNKPVSNDVLDHKHCGKNESKSDSSPCGHDGNSSSSASDQKISNSYSGGN